MIEIPFEVRACKYLTACTQHAHTDNSMHTQIWIHVHTPPDTSLDHRHTHPPTHTPDTYEETSDLEFQHSDTGLMKFLLECKIKKMN